MGSFLVDYTMTPQVVDRRMAVLHYLAPVVVQLPLVLDKFGSVNEKLRRGA